MLPCLAPSLFQNTSVSIREDKLSVFFSVLVHSIGQLLV